MSVAVYFLSFATNLACCILLLRAYRDVRKRLLLWSGLCFAGLAVSSAILFVDLVWLADDVSLFVYRLLTSIAAVSLLLYGLIVEEP